MMNQAALLLLACLLAVALAADRHRRQQDDGDGDADTELIVDGGGSSDPLAQSVQNGSATPQNGQRKANRVKPCCTMPRMADKEMMAAVKECRIATSAKNRTTVTRVRQPGYRCLKRLHGCFAECVYKKSALLTVENKIDHTKVKGRIIQFLEETNKTSWKTIAEKAFDSCSAAGNKIPPQQRCKSGSLELAMCFRNNMIMNCPAEHWRKDEWCRARKERLTGNSIRPGRMRLPLCPEDT